MYWRWTIFCICIKNYELGMELCTKHKITVTALTLYNHCGQSESGGILVLCLKNNSCWRQNYTSFLTNLAVSMYCINECIHKTQLGGGGRAGHRVTISRRRKNIIINLFLLRQPWFLKIRNDVKIWLLVYRQTYPLWMIKYHRTHLVCRHPFYLWDISLI